MNSPTQVEDEQMSDWSDGFIDDITHVMDTSVSNENEDNAQPETSSKKLTSKEVDSEDEPLAAFQRRTRNNLAERSHTDEDFDDTDADTDYQPSKDDLNSSDSNMSELEPRRKQAWKKKAGKSIKRKLFKAKRTHLPSRDLKDKVRKKRESMKLRPTRIAQRKGSRCMERAKQKSHRLHNLKQMIRNHHIKRLDNLLACNGFRRVAVTADGDCFFSALQTQIQIDWSIETFREHVAEHLAENIDHYIHFLHDDGSSVDRTERFGREVESIKEKGQWKANIADCIPLAAANVLKHKIQIFSSDVSNPVYEIKPDLVEFDQNSYIHLAYLRIKREEHYDGVDSCVRGNVSDKGNDPDPMLTPAKSRPDTEDIGITPHKEAVYVSPKTKESCRKRKSTPELWKRNVRKRNRDCGFAYVSQRGKQIQQRTMKEQDCSKCKFKCNTKLSEDDRKQIFDTYWGLQDYNRQRDFICQSIKDVSPQRIKTGRRKTTLQYAFDFSTRRVRVCKMFFLNTLGIGRKTVTTAMKKKSIGGVFAGGDKRGKFPSANKTPVTSIQLVHSHIKSFPTMESHYVRKQSRRKYLAQDLNITKMWHLYASECKTKGVNPVSQAKYRHIFCSEYNYSFFKPKKDQCSQCTKFSIKKAEGSVDEAIEETHKSHLRRKENSREQKSNDKTRAKTDKSVYAATFDLQAVLNTPCTMVGVLYYKRKLSCYNLSFYSLGDENGTCYLWDESQAGRGSCEIGTCLLTQINSITNTHSAVKEITFYSDTCGGQNRNKYVVSAYLYAISKANTLEVINHKFFEPGHSQMESDSMHAVIENTKKKTVVYVPSQWHTIISLARRKKPYIVVPMKYTDVLNLKLFSQQFCPNMKVSTANVRVNWLKIVWIKVEKTSPGSVFLNETFDENTFMEIKVSSRTRSKNQFPNVPSELEGCYKDKIPISNDKKADLISLCRSGLIPEEFHAYYEGLQILKNKKDCLPMPDASDTEYETESDAEY